MSLPVSIGGPREEDWRRSLENRNEYVDDYPDETIWDGIKGVVVMGLIIFGLPFVGAVVMDAAKALGWVK